MGTLHYSKTKQEQLQQLTCVEKVTKKMLVFKQSFKREGVAKSQQDYTANQIFREAGIRTIAMDLQNKYEIIINSKN